MDMACSGMVVGKAELQCPFFGLTGGGPGRGSIVGQPLLLLRIETNGKAAVRAGARARFELGLVGLLSTVLLSVW